MATDIIPQATKTRTIKNPKQIQSKSRSHTVTPQGNDVFTVASGTSGKEYTVNFFESGATCTCEWGAHRPSGDKRSGCSHVTAVLDFIAAESNRTVSVWASAEDAKRQHKPTLSIGDGVHITARLKPAPILWVIQRQNQDQVRVLEVL
jgi:hypothetical protein